MGDTFTIYVDLETAGLTDAHPNIQLAAVAINDSTGAEAGTFNRKIKFDEAKADSEALKLNHYDPEVWQREAIDQNRVVIEFSRWAEQFRCITMTSARTGNPYTVSKLAGHNIVAFDGPRIRRMFGTNFFPFSYHSKDTLQRALWYFDEHPEIARPASLKLTLLAEHFGIPTEGAHDALFDVRLSAVLASAIRKAERNGG